MKKIVTGALLIIALFISMGSACDDPGNPKTGGKVHHTVIAIGNGSTISKATYGLWHADDTAPSKCHWNVTIKGKNVASGSKSDAIIAGSGLRGGIVHTNCGSFHK